MSESADARPLPGPDGLPFVGSFLEFRRDPFAFYDDLREYGGVVGYRMMGYDMCSVLDPDAIEDVLLNEADAFQKPALLGESLDDYMAEGVLLTEGEQWRAQRTMLQPMFYRERVEGYGDLMADYAVEAAAEWASDGEVDVQSATSDLTLRILARTLFDVDLDERAAVVREFADAVSEIGRAGSLESQLPGWVPLPSRRRHRRAFENFDDALRNLVDERRASGGSGDDTPDDLLTLLLDADYPDGSTPSETEIRDQLMTFLFAGHETTALALTWAFVLLERRPETYDRLRQEVDDVLDDDRAAVADLPDLTYTDWVAREVLRLRPPAGALFREPREDVELAGYHVPEGTMVVLPQFAVQTDPRFFEAPEEFRPERWAGDLEDDLPDYAYFPFGGGPRHCIGMRFAALELRLALATIVRNVDVSVRNPDVDPDLGTPFAPAEDVRADVTER
ncbi:cytochrome P450 [Halobacterium wangiae]|uniref:cytochrome P450 n=1 Tax=Halobacterium wangiae TaxID=2902623 RepID=UPI001E3DEE69|nr:cytochrome P450 [Halobacterium wangiae]